MLAAMALIGLAGLASAQPAANPQILEWIKTLDAANSALVQPQTTEEALVELRQRLTESRV